MKHSAGLLVYQRNPLRVFLVHPGGPYWAAKDDGAWGIPKGEIDAAGENAYDLAFETALREFLEETGQEATGRFMKMNPVAQSKAKMVHAWAVECDVDADNVVSNTCTTEWPPKSGTIIEVPEIDRGGWFEMAAARQKIRPGQLPLLDQLQGWFLPGGECIPMKNPVRIVLPPRESVYSRERPYPNRALREDSHDG